MEFLKDDDDVLSGKFFLLACEEISAVKHTTVARVFIDAMHILCSGGVKYDNVLLLLTDAAPYMIKAHFQWATRKWSTLRV